MELKATRVEADGAGGHGLAAPPAPAQRLDGADAHRVPLAARPARRATAAVRAIVVTGTPPAFCVGGDSDALAGHAERGGYDAGLPAERADPGPRRPARARRRLRLPAGHAHAGDRRGQRRGAGVGLAVALLLPTCASARRPPS